MSISLRRYVDITSGVGAGVNVGERQLIGRFFDDNALIPTNSHVEFTSADDVLSYFGSSSLEYARAAFYFGWVSKNVTAPGTMSFARWNSAASAPQIFGAKGSQAVASYSSISTGSFTLAMGGATHTLSSLDFTAATSLSDVAGVVQDAIQDHEFPAYFTGVIATSMGVDTLTVTSIDGALAIGDTITGAGVDPDTTITAFVSGTGGNGTYTLSSSGQAISSEAMTGGDSNTFWATALVVWNSTRQSFDLTGGDTGTATITVTAGTGGNDIAGQLGWLSATAIFSDGAPIQTITEVLSTSANADNNFGSFTFTATLTQDQIVEAATWNDTQNNMFMYSVRCTSANASALSAALDGLSGVTLTLSPLANEYPEQVPMMIFAATDYLGRNTTQNYMFQIFTLSASVTSDTDADTYDALHVNYYGQTQTAGQILKFYQRGHMLGLASDALDQNTYANEVWLKDAASAAIMTLLLSLNKISANATGRAQILNILQGVINQALFNGTISAGKTLSDTQKLFVTNATGDPLAWKQVQNIGYWVDVVIVPFVVDDVTEYKAVYTLIYGKDDVIRKVEGSDILI